MLGSDGNGTGARIADGPEAVGGRKSGNKLAWDGTGEGAPSILRIDAERLRCP